MDKVRDRCTLLFELLPTPPCDPGYEHEKECEKGDTSYDAASHRSCVPLLRSTRGSVAWWWRRFCRGRIHLRTGNVVITVLCDVVASRHLLLQVTSTAIDANKCEASTLRGNRTCGETLIISASPDRNGIEGIVRIVAVAPDLVIDLRAVGKRCAIASRTIGRWGCNCCT